ncbi:hypothetical protein TRIP_B110108 [uncultured Desulfatiglans sp.]|uniref:Uncharacterized protein n=1 Tax=Uncultured Desulfatiglans sp. TaxID=1748965 RepID=A0A653A0I5_UNCDX|nr:hypothetical protein TRIP_B110108 [uncultured Desulfatiglans sp.]
MFFRPGEGILCHAPPDQARRSLVDVGFFNAFVCLSRRRVGIYRPSFHFSRLQPFQA